jgi:hypothetical protein
MLVDTLERVNLYGAPGLLAAPECGDAAARLRATSTIHDLRVATTGLWGGADFDLSC